MSANGGSFFAASVKWIHPATVDGRSNGSWEFDAVPLLHLDAAVPLTCYGPSVLV